MAYGQWASGVLRAQEGSTSHATPIPALDGDGRPPRRLRGASTARSGTAQPPRAEPSQTWDAPPGAPRPGSLAYRDVTNGFRDLTFGDEPTPDMRRTERTGDTTLYRRPWDELTWGGAGLRDLA